MTIRQFLKRIKIKIKDILYILGYGRNKQVLVYLGLNEGVGFSTLFRNYKMCYAFEADPNLCLKLKKRFKKYKGVQIINAAVAKDDGEIQFNISNNNGLSSSIGIFKEDWNAIAKIEMIKTITIPSINLYNFLQKRNVNYIDDYVSDIQGYDLAVLKTLEPMIKGKKINTITAEVTKDKHKNIYENLPDNNLSGFSKLLNKNYTLAATGEGILIKGVFNDVPKDWWEMDCMWMSKK